MIWEKKPPKRKPKAKDRLDEAMEVILANPERYQGVMFICAQAAKARHEKEQKP